MDHRLLLILIFVLLSGETLFAQPEKTKTGPPSHAGGDIPPPRNARRRHLEDDLTDTKSQKPSFFLFSLRSNEFYEMQQAKLARLRKCGFQTKYAEVDNAMDLEELLKEEAFKGSSTTGLPPFLEWESHGEIDEKSGVFVVNGSGNPYTPNAEGAPLVEVLHHRFPKSSIFVSTCHSGACLRETNCKSLGASCGRNQTAQVLPNLDETSRGTPVGLLLEEILCDSINDCKFFKSGQADANGDGTITGPELMTHWKKKWGVGYQRTLELRVDDEGKSEFSKWCNSLPDEHNLVEQKDGASQFWDIEADVTVSAPGIVFTGAKNPPKKTTFRVADSATYKRTDSASVQDYFLNTPGLDSDLRGPIFYQLERHASDWGLPNIIGEWELKTYRKPIRVVAKALSGEKKQPIEIEFAIANLDQKKKIESKKSHVVTCWYDPHPAVPFNAPLSAETIRKLEATNTTAYTHSERHKNLPMFRDDFKIECRKK